jgi:hypothetical protein
MHVHGIHSSLFTSDAFVTLCTMCHTATADMRAQVARQAQDIRTSGLAALRLAAASSRDDVQAAGEAMLAKLDALR